MYLVFKPTSCLLMSLLNNTFKSAALISLLSPTLVLAQTSGKMNLDKWDGISGNAVNYLQQKPN